MAHKYRAKKRNKTVIDNREISPKEPPLIGKGKIVLLLVIGTALAAGIYVAAMKMQFAPVFYAYWIITTVLICAFIFLNQRRDYLYAKMTSDGKPDEKALEADRRRRKHIKYLLLVLLPFLFTVIGDTVYLVLLKDSGIIEGIKALFISK